MREFILEYYGLVEPNANIIAITAIAHSNVFKLYPPYAIKSELCEVINSLTK